MEHLVYHVRIEERGTARYVLAFYVTCTPDEDHSHVIRQAIAEHGIVNAGGQLRCISRTVDYIPAGADVTHSPETTVPGGFGDYFDDYDPGNRTRGRRTVYRRQLSWAVGEQEPSRYIPGGKVHRHDGTQRTRHFRNGRRVYPIEEAERAYDL